MNAYIKNIINLIPNVSTSRNIALEALKGFLMILIVMGHLTTGGVIHSENIWYENLKQAIYSFHMPLFFIISGIIFPIQINDFIQRNKHSGYLKQYIIFVSERSKRLLIPFIGIGVIIVLGKYFIQPSPEIGHASVSIYDGIISLFYNTEYSPARFIWFLFTLYCLLIIFFPIIKLHLNKINYLLYASLPIFLLLFLFSADVPDVLYFNRFARHAIFFVIGLFIANSYQIIIDFLKTILPLSIILFGTLITIAITYDFSPVIRFSIVPMAAMMMFLALFHYDFAIDNKILKILSKYSFVIFLFNLPCIALTKMIIQKTIGWNPIIFNVSFPILIIAGLLGPVLIKILFFRHIPIVHKYTN